MPKMDKNWFTFLGGILFGAMAVALDYLSIIPFAVTFRVGCAGGCLIFIYMIGSDYPGERWPRIALFIALLFNVGMFFSPLAGFPASKGDILFFGVPDLVILLAARAFSYPVADAHRRAVRQQLFVGLILALAFCAMILSILLFHPPKAQ